MGCFDSTCSVSHNPICEGDDTVVLFVGANIKPIYGSITYEAIMFPLFGIYNDYGDIEGIDETSYEWKISQWMIETQFKDVIRPTHRETDDWSVFKDQIHISAQQCLPDSWANDGSKCVFELQDPPSYSPDQIVYEQTERNNTTVGRMFIHRKVYDYFVDSYLNHKIGYSVKKPVFKTFVDDIPEFVQLVVEKERLVKQYNQIDIKDEEAQYKLLTDNNTTEFQLLYNFDGRLIIIPDDKTFKFSTDNYHPLNEIFAVNRDFRSFHFQAMIVFRELFQQLCSDEKLEEAELLLSKMMEVHCFVMGLKLHNTEMTPYGGFTWEQSRGAPDARRMKRMFKTFASVADNRIKRCKAWDEE